MNCKIVYKILLIIIRWTSCYGSFFELSEEINSNDGISNILEINKNNLFNEIDINKIKNENYENNDSFPKKLEMILI